MGEKTTKKIETWNTWDVQCLNGVMKIPDMPEVRVALYDDREKLYQDEFSWKDVVRFGFHHPWGKCFDINLRFQDMVFTMQFASEGDSFVYRIVPHNPIQEIKFYVAGMFRWRAGTIVEKRGNTLVLQSKKERYTISVFGDLDEQTLVNVSHQGILLQSGKPIYIRCNNTLSLEEMDSYIEEKKREAEEELVTGDGMLEDVPQAVIKGVVWNTIYEPVKERVCTPVSRAWCTGSGTYFGSYVLFAWDTFFNGLLGSIQNKKLAYRQVYSILEEITPRGMIPNFGSQKASSLDRSQPPVGSYCVLKLYRQFGEKELLAQSFDRLFMWNRWWMKNRDGNGDGLLEWGSDPYPEGSRLGYEAHNLQAAKYESGLDNSPMYDDVVFNPNTHTMELTDVGLNALYALDCRSLSEIAREIGNTELASELEREYQCIRQLVNQKLWCEEKGIYCNRYWNGKFNFRLSPTNFYPLIAGIPSDDQAGRMIEDHLLNTEEFWGRYVIPSIARKDKAFRDNNYWRGRIWGPMNFLVSEGIKQYGFYKVAYQFAKKSLDLFMKEWKEENHIHENYNAVTGDGDDVSSANPFYTWGGLLAYVAIGEVIDPCAFGTIRIGNLNTERASVRNYPIADSRFDVTTGERLVVCKNGKPFIDSTIPVIITQMKQNDSTLHLTIVTENQGLLTVYLESNIENVVIEVDGNCTKYQNTDPSRELVKVTFSIEPSRVPLVISKTFPHHQGR